ncbi:trypsin-like serine protease [Streptomyces aureus]|uniref:VMAP-C domain-containing protein n=1 Tax=Streptomyces aureus TaxID=193461 RepID=UPI0006E2A101|nr:trypsin-like serine protease [Streptomyces aureus]
MDPRRLALIRSGTDDRPHRVGSGYLITPRLVLTARHVLEDRATGLPWPAFRVRIGHHGYGETTAASAELLWQHPDGRDVALLRIDRDVDLSGTVRWGRPVGTAPLSYRGLGYPLSAKGDTRDPENLRGELPPLSGAADRFVLDQGPSPVPRADEKNAWGGASGAAIFCGDRLVGVVTQEVHSYGARRLIALPARTFAQDDDFVSHLVEHAGTPPELGTVGAPLPSAPPAAERTPAERELAGMLDTLFPDRASRIGHARDLARELEYETDGYEPTTADLVALLKAHPRALASLGAAPARSATGPVRTAWTQLFARARVLAPGSLLSTDEYGSLLDLLCRVHEEQPRLLPRAAPEALPYAVLPESLTRPHLGEDDLRAAIHGLEELSDSESVPEGTPPVPALLRLVEYVAASAAHPLGDELRAWSSAIADRLGVHAGALGERRDDANRWAKRRSSPVTRVVMEVERDTATAEERYRCRILLAREDGSYRVLKESETVSKTPGEAARALGEAVATARQEPGQGDHVPWVTVVVDRSGLDLAVDEWRPEGPDDILAAWPIGTEYHVSLSCPDLVADRTVRELDQKRRWKLGRSSTLTTSRTHGHGGHLRMLLGTEHRDTARVVLHGPADQRKSSLMICLALGVPVVLWDRDADGYEDADRLGGLAPDGGLDALPERVREFRSHSAAHPEERRARPSLVWEPDGRHPAPEPLHLRDPWRGTHAS